MNDATKLTKMSEKIPKPLYLEPESSCFEEGLTAAIIEKMVCISVAEEKAVDSYNVSFECNHHLTEENVIALRDWLDCALSYINQKTKLPKTSDLSLGTGHHADYGEHEVKRLRKLITYMAETLKDVLVNPDECFRWGQRASELLALAKAERSEP